MFESIFDIPTSTQTLMMWSLLAVCGLLIHFLKHLVQARKENPDLTAWGYWNNNRAQAVLAIVGAVAMFFIANEMGQLNGLMAFGCGYMGNSAADILGSRVQKIGK